MWYELPSSPIGEASNKILTGVVQVKGKSRKETNLNSGHNKSSRLKAHSNLKAADKTKVTLGRTQHQGRKNYRFNSLTAPKHDCLIRLHCMICLLPLRLKLNSLWFGLVLLTMSDPLEYFNHVWPFRVLSTCFIECDSLPVGLLIFPSIRLRLASHSLRTRTVRLSYNKLSFRFQSTTSIAFVRGEDYSCPSRYE